jgi:hypothetical protein
MSSVDTFTVVSIFHLPSEALRILFVGYFTSSSSENNNLKRNLKDFSLPFDLYKGNTFLIKKSLDKEVAEIAYNYLLLKIQVTKLFFEKKYISPFEEIFGTWSDSQVPGTYSIYGDILM